MANATVKGWKNKLECGLSKLKSQSGKFLKPELNLCKAVSTLAQHPGKAFAHSSADGCCGIVEPSQLFGLGFIFLSCLQC